MKCPKCGSKNLDIVQSGPHSKLICTECLAFVKFLNKVQAESFRQLKTKEATK